MRLVLSSLATFFSNSLTLHTLEQLRSGQLKGVQRIKLSCGLREFPREIFGLADTLEVLDLSGNELFELPDDLPRLHKLRILFCSNNHFTSLPEVIGRCEQLEMVGFKANRIAQVPASSLPPKLRWLILTDNQIKTIPAEIGRCARLQKLMLAGNQLHALPVEMSACGNLELVRIAANRFEALPHWLLELPRLAWLAYAGNPFCLEGEQTVLKDGHLPDINWSALELMHLLGEGASGVIHSAQWRAGGEARAVAVKMFKGAVTSDGLPLSEMAACAQAGEHPNLITVHGKVAVHPEGTHGLVLALVDQELRNLAGPPSLESCTRDIYAGGTRFSMAHVMNIARSMASVAAHLHTQGLMHGDLYAHNTLHCEGGSVMLGDFGAASFLPDDEEQALALQRIEVRAFGCLLEELLSHCDADPDEQERQAALKVIQARCLGRITSRPLFADIVAELDSL